MADDDFFDSDKAGTETGQMWRRLAEQIRDAIPGLVIADSDPVKAIRWACCAEACFWKATGEADAHDIKDVLKFDQDAGLPTAEDARGIIPR